jgi:hypothetical protein
MKWQLLAASLTVAAATAQQRELGLFGGGGLVNSLGIRDSASAGFAGGPAAGAFVGHDLYDRWSGEIRYVYAARDLQISSGAQSAAMRGDAHALHYDMLFHTHPRGRRVRPFVAFGGGVKIFRGVGTEEAYRPLMDYAFLTRTRELKPMLSLGAGIKFRIASRLVLRIEARDQLTAFPGKVITPAKDSKISGLLHDVVPAAGLGWVF